MDSVGVLKHKSFAVHKTRFFFFSFFQIIQISTALCSLKQVSPIPDKFSSRQHYMGSFIVSLIEETRADLSSSIRTACEASESESESSTWEPTSVDTAARELMSIENPSQFKLPRYFLYDVSLKSVEGNGNNAEVYEPQAGDIIALTDKIPYYIESESCYNIALVTGSYGKTSDKLQIQSPKPMMHEQIMSDNKKRRTIYAVYLINITTNNCIWEALHRSPRGGNIRIIDKVLQTDSSVRIIIHFSLLGVFFLVLRIMFLLIHSFFMMAFLHLSGWERMCFVLLWFRGLQICNRFRGQDSISRSKSFPRGSCFKLYFCSHVSS